MENYIKVGEYGILISFDTEKIVFIPWESGVCFSLSDEKLFIIYPDDTELHLKIKGTELTKCFLAIVNRTVTPNGYYFTNN